jgi:hypothetical protein
MDTNYVEMRRAVTLATIKAMDLIRGIEAQIETAGAFDDEGKPVPNPFGVRLVCKVSAEKEAQVRAWIDVVVRAAHDAHEEPSDETLQALEFALSQLRAGERELAYQDALTWLLVRYRITGCRGSKLEKH